MFKLEPKFVKEQFSKLIWPNTKFIASTGMWCAFIITLLGLSLVYFFDPLAIKIVMLLSGE